jgi:plastocyanin
MRYSVITRAIGAAGVVLAAACGSSTSPYGGGGGGGGGGGSGGGHTASLSIGDDFFSPTPDTVTAGQVTFTWSGAVSHNVTWDSGPTTPMNSMLQSSGTYSATLQVGTYQYHCTIHGGPGTGMHGTIVVK